MPPYIQNPRRLPRIALRMPIEVSHRGESWMAETEDLGPGGCLVLSPVRLVERAPVRLVLRCEVLREALNVTGSVAWARDARAGVAFAARQIGFAPRPEAWFKRVLDAHPRLATELARVPDRIATDAPLYLLPAPRSVLDLAPDEVALLRQAENGIAVHVLLSAAGLAEARAAKALFALFDKGVLTLALGRAGEAWKWRAALSGSGPAPTPIPSPSPVRDTARALRPAPMAWLGPDAWHAASRPPVGRSETAPVPLARVGRLAGGGAPLDPTLLRGVSPARRSPEAQARLEQARQAADADRIDRAVGLLRQALALAPRDAEISKLLGDLAFKNRRL